MSISASSRVRSGMIAAITAGCALAIALAGVGTAHADAASSDAPATVALSATACPVQSSTLTWGFKESFRSYISGSIANGEWTVADGATYETPSFGWIDGVGTFDGETGEGSLAFAGSVTFTGHGGILNTTISNPTVQFIDSDSAVILVDVSGTTQEGAAIDAKSVEFVTLDLSDTIAATGGVLTVTDAPATLTADGSEAFGTYEAGEAFDPVTIELGIDPACATITVPTTAPIAPTEPIAAAPTLWWLWLVGGLVLLGAMVAVIVVVLRRRV